MNSDITKKRFETMYLSESDTIFRYCLFRVSNRELALDLVQETFMRFWDSLIQKKEIKNDRAFLFTISRNLIIDHYRKKKSSSLDKILEEVEDGTMLLSDSSQSQNSLFSAESRFFLEKINDLDDADRQVVYLRFVEDLKPKDISEVLDLSPNVVSVRLNRALNRLREITGLNIQEE